MKGPQMKFPGFVLTVDTLDAVCFKGYKIGDEFVVKDFVTPPDGFCAGAYHSLFPILYGWTFGAQFPFADAEGSVRTTCPDGGKLTFKVRLVKDGE
jgi:uncharacterized repeat protein (TIGR04076 family)